MWNGPWLGRRAERIAGNSSEKSSEKESGSGGLWPRALVAMAALLLAGSALLASGFHHSAEQGAARLPMSSMQGSATSSLPWLHSKPQHSNLDARAILGQLPLIFEPNRGQADARVKFLARGAGYDLFLDTAGAVLAMQTAHSPAGRSERFVRMKLVGAKAGASTAGTDPLPGKSNYIMGNDPHQWHTGVPQFAGVRYHSVYPGIDLVFYGNQGRLEYDFQIAPGADPGASRAAV